MTMSLDGYVEGPDGKIDWTAPDDELFRHHTERIAYVRTHLCGRRLWEAMASYWPGAEHDPATPPLQREFAQLWNGAEHIVFSRTLRAVDHGARLVTSDAVAEVQRLKAGDGGDMEVGGATLARALLEAGLVDEVHAYVCPVTLGGGKPILPRGIALEPLGVKTFASGVVQLRYAPRR